MGKSEGIRVSGLRGGEGEGVRGCEGDSCIRKTQILLSMFNLS